MTGRCSEMDLIDRARGGNRIALEELLRLHLHDLSAHISKRMPETLKRKLDFEDITQQALLEAFVKIDRLRETSQPAFRAWLKAIGEITMLRLLRDQRRKKRGGDYRQLESLSGAASSMENLLSQLPDTSKTASSVVARRQAVTALRVAVAGLPVDQRQAIEFHLLKGLSVDETAETMERTPAAVRGLIHRGKQKLAESMGHASDWLSS